MTRADRLSRKEKAGIVAAVLIGVLHACALLAADVLCDMLMDSGAREKPVVVWAWQRRRF